MASMCSPSDALKREHIYRHELKDVKRRTLYRQIPSLFHINEKQFAQSMFVW